MIVLRKMHEIANTHKELALSYLCIGAIFFAMRSCEYLISTHKEDSKRTRIIRLRNIKFKKQGILLTINSPNLFLSDIVMITFEYQKNNNRNKTVHMYKTNDDLLCPVKAWAYTITRILKTVPNANSDTKVCAYVDSGQVRHIDSTYARARLRGIVELIGQDILGFTKEEAGLHSIRSGGAMAMFLSAVPTIIIQRIGRWDSDAFMEYIREQVESFTIGVSSKMILNEKFYHLNQVSTQGIEDQIENSPIQQGDGDPILTPNATYFSDQVLKQTKFTQDQDKYE